MLMHDNLNTIFNEVVYDNNAQEVFKKLNDLDNKRDVLVSRWVWELIQNARGTAGSQNTLQIEVVLDRDQLLFRHNGPHFKDREIAHLIYHGSSKHDPKDIGKFGSGFITTHLLSRQVRVRGTLEDGRSFDFVLKREGKDAAELRAAMEKSKTDFIASLVRNPETVPAPFTTEYAYPVSECIREIVFKGIQALRLSAPYIFAFNFMLQRLKISTPDESVDLTRKELEPLFPASRYQGLCLNERDPKQWLVTLAGNNVEASIALNSIGDKLAVQLPISVPRLFVAFPLNNTENFGLPLVLNSESFATPEDRDGIYLGTSENEINSRNKELFVAGCQTIVRLISLATQQSWVKTANATAIQPFTTPSWANDVWLRSQICDVLVKGFRTEKLLRAVSGNIIAPQSAWIPIAQNSASAAKLWCVTGKLNVAADFLPCQEDYEAWSQSLQSWIPFLKDREQQPTELWSVDKLAALLESLKNVAGVGLALQKETDPISWINDVNSLIVQAGCFDLFRQRALIPNENGDLVPLGSLHLHDKIDATLKDIAEQLGFAVRATLIHTGIICPDVHKALNAYTESSLVSKTLELVRARFTEQPLPEAVRHASVKFFGWLLIRGQTAQLDNYPVLSQVDSSENLMSHLKLHANSDEKQRWLAPIELWPDPAKEFSDLFSHKVILHPSYVDACSKLESWNKLEANGYLRLAPFFELESKVSDFLPDELFLPEKSKPTSETAHIRSQIPFFSGDDHLVLNRARGSSKRAIKVLKFLFDYILPTDLHAFEEVTAICDNGKDLKFYRAGWLTSLRNRWVPMGEGQSEPSAQSMADLLAAEPELLKRLSHQRIARLFTVMGVSPADLLLRTVGHDDQERMSLIQSLAQITNAMGHNAERVKALAGAIEEDPEVLVFAEQRRQRREIVKRNQALGALVENLFKAAFQGSGFVATRTGPGHDYFVAEGEEEDVGKIEIGSSNGKVYVEIKATTTNVARMSVKQVQEAVTNKERYFLCVVAVPGSNLDIGDFKAKARFVLNIGDLFQNLWNEFVSMQNAVSKTAKYEPGLAIELTEQQAKFRVDEAVWQAGVDFSQVIAEFNIRLIKGVKP
jgi:hypothetical protein